MTESVYFKVFKIENLFKTITDYLNYDENNKFSLLNKTIYEFYLNKKSVKAINLNDYNKNENMVIILKKLIKKHKGITKIQLNTGNCESFKLLLLFPEIEELKLTVTSIENSFILKKLKKLKNLILILDPDKKTDKISRYKKNKHIDINYFEVLEKLTIIVNSRSKLNYKDYYENNTVRELVYIIKDSDGHSLELLKKFKNVTYLKIECRKALYLPNINFLNDFQNLEKLSLNGFGKLDFSILRNLNKLKSLSLSFDKIPDLSILKSICLEEFCIAIKEEIEFDISELEEFKSLKKLKIQYILLNDLSFLESLNNLEYLDLSGNEYIINYEPIKYLSNLKVLILKDCKLIDINFVSGLNKLEVLDLTNNKFIDCYEPIKKLKCLKVVKKFTLNK